MSESAIWSAAAAAIAAISSAIAAFAMLRIQHRSLLESSRPELVLDEWDRITNNEEVFERDVLSFNKVSNEGKGSAYHVYININEHEILDHSLPAAHMATTMASIVPSGKAVSLNSKITLLWQNAKSIGNNEKYIPIEIKIYCWCSSGYRHETIYKLMVFEPNRPLFMANNGVAPGVSLVHRRTINSPVWWLKLFRFFGKKILNDIWVLIIVIGTVGVLSGLIIYTK